MRLKKILFITLVLVILGVSFRYFQPLPDVSAVSKLDDIKTSTAIDLPWPIYGQAALSAQGYGLLATNGQQTAAPMASITKVVTALAVLKKKPLTAGQAGPSITINANDVAIYNSYYSRGGSVVKVEASEQITQRQALEALLIPSANNVADTLAIWAFGSMDSFTIYTNQMLQELGLSQTKVADASGFSPDSASTAQDLARLGLAALNNPTLAEIVGQQTADLPLAGTVNNVNWLLGSDGVIGIKTGNTDQAGGCFLFAAKRSIGTETVTLVGAILQAPDLNTAIKDSRAVIAASDKGFEFVKIASKDQAVGTYQAPWGANAEAIASQDLSVLAWRGSQLESKVKLDKINSSSAAGTNVGAITITSGQKTASVPVVLKSNLASPSWHWRLIR